MILWILTAHVIGIRDGTARGEKVIILRTANQTSVQRASYYLVGRNTLSVKIGKYFVVLPPHTPGYSKNPPFLLCR